MRWSPWRAPEDGMVLISRMGVHENSDEQYRGAYSIILLERLQLIANISLVYLEKVASPWR